MPNLLSIAGNFWHLLPLGGQMYMPHGSCYLWQTPLVALHLISDLLIAIAYFSIPVMLIYFVRKRQDMPFSRVFVLFGAFIVACGFGHLLEIVTLWFPIYWVTGIEQAITALISCYTAMELFSLLPMFLALKSPEALEEINQQLQIEIQERQKTEALINRIIQGTASVTGDDFFPALVENLAITLDVLQVQITETGTTQTLASWRNPKFREQSLPIIAEVQDITTAENTFTSYINFPITDRNNVSIGTLRVYHYESTIDREQATTLIAIFASRAAAEIERRYARADLASANQQLAEINNQLEAKVTERTQAIATSNQLLEERIAESRIVEEALRNSEERFRSLVVNMPGVVYRCLPDEQWTMQFLSNGIEQLTGYPATDFLDNRIRAFNEIIHPDDRTSLQFELEEITPTSSTYKDEYRVLCADGNIRWVYEQGTALFDLENQVTCLEGVILDVTDRKLADKALEQERRQLRQLIQNMPVAMAMCDTNMYYIAHSKQWLKDYNLGDEILVGRSHFDVFVDLPERYRANIQSALAGEIVARDEDCFIQPDGTKHYLKWTMQPWYYTADQVGGIIIVAQNIQDLVKGREAAIEASRLKSSFLANMSHEIRTPMNGIIGIAELLHTTPLNIQQQDFVKTLNNSAEHLLSLINDILDFSKLEAGEMTLESMPLDLVECVEAVAELLAFAAHHKKVELLTFVDPQLSQVLMGDAVRLRQILTNLVGNAIKFTASGSVEIRVMQTSQTADQVTIRCEVIDTGIGIKPEDKEKLFRSFSQVDPSTTRQYGGTGLGLAIAKQLTTMMGGSIGIESTWGQGSTFWFTAVLDRLDTIASFPELPTQKILVIDSHDKSQHIVNEYLTACGMEVESCGNFVEGLVILEQEKKYDLVLLALPILSAQKSIQVVLQRLQPLLPLEKVVILISSIDYPFLREWLQAQRIRHLLKPLQQKSLFNCLQQDSFTQEQIEDGTTFADSFTKTMGRSSIFRILLVEDAVVNQTVIQNQLNILGFEDIDCVENGRIALERLKTEKYDLILMDCLMPELDGYSTTERIREGEAEGEHQLIVAMTANVMEGDRDKCITAGMDDYISKPTTIASIQTVLERILQPMELPPITAETDTQELVSEAKLNDRPMVSRGSEAETVIDLERLKLFYGENLAFQKQMFAKLLTFLPQYFAGLRVAIAAEDFEQITYHVHRLKGSVASASVNDIPQWCQAIETAVVNKDLVRIKILEVLIDEALQEVYLFLENYIAAH
ncbi:MAG: response regulator [Limnothrix sp. RL_2_0]|nr:response regulator [Limnothrix sp. RL_2_0]